MQSILSPLSGTASSSTLNSTNFESIGVHYHSRSDYVIPNNQLVCEDEKSSSNVYLNESSNSDLVLQLIDEVWTNVCEGIFEKIDILNCINYVIGCSKWLIFSFIHDGNNVHDAGIGVHLVIRRSSCDIWNVQLKDLTIINWKDNWRTRIVHKFINYGDVLYALGQSAVSRSEWWVGVWRNI